MNENLFGRVYDVIGDSSQDLLLKTKGQVKIKWGNKYIDLIKNGNINYPKESIIKLINDNVKQYESGMVILFNKDLSIPQGWTRLTTDEFDVQIKEDFYVYIKKE